MREIHQTGDKHVVCFDADVELLPNSTTVTVELISLYSDPWHEVCDISRMHAQDAVDSIQEGIEEALRPRGIGAFVLVSNLVMHATHFRPRKHKPYAREYLEAALGRLTLPLEAFGPSGKE